MDALRPLFITAILVAAALPAGACALRLLGLGGADFSDWREAVSVATAAGLGAIALILTLCGFAGVLYSPVVLAAPVLLAATGLSSLWRLRGGIEARPSRDCGLDHGLAPDVPKALRRLIGGCVAALGVSVLVQDLAPPTDYDGLLYHLVMPRAYLASHAIVYLPHNFSANLPGLGEMLYTFGLAAGSDRAPQLLHGACGGLCLWLTYVLGRRMADPTVAALGAASLASTPLLPFLMTRAYIDLWTLLFALLAVTALAAWREQGGRHWLLLIGSATGLALDTKYAAISLVIVCGAAILLHELTGNRDVAFRSRRVPRAFRLGTCFSFAALGTAAPWYLRQVAVLGNPVWPMYFGGRDWDAGRVHQLTYFISHYGSGRAPVDWLLLPLRVYTESWRFGHVPGSYPPLVALASPFALLAPPAAALLLGGIAGGLIGFWLVGWQDLRFLLPAYPLLALLGTRGLLALSGRLLPRAPAPMVVASIVAPLCAYAVAYEGAHAWNAVPVVFGREGTASYLVRMLPDQRAIERLNAELAPGKAALFLGDGQIWYCRGQCIPDAAHDNLLMWFVRPGSPEAALARLQREGVSHVLLSKRDYWYLQHQDPDRLLDRHLAAFYVFKAKYLESTYEDDLTELYRVRA